MARNTTPKGPIQIGAVQHGDKRLNIPTADAHDFITPDIEEIRRVRYERDETLDPQLVWRGKYPATAEDVAAQGEDANDLILDAPPIYIQEKIDPRVLIENFRREVGKQQEGENGQIPLFPTYGSSLNEIEAVEFYKHDTEWANRMVLGDSLQVMTSLAEREKLRGKVQMVYIDPPYGIKFGSNWQVSTRNRKVADGRLEDAAREAEQIKAFRDTWELGIHSYLSYLRDRIIAARDLLTDSGSCLVQIGDENAHLVRALMDEVFGPENFVSQIAFKKTGGQSSTRISNVIDYILWYGKTRDIKYHDLYETKVPGEEGATQYRWVEEADGTRRSLRSSESIGSDSGRLFQPYPLTSDGPATSPQEFEWQGKKFLPSAGSHWKVTLAGLRTVEIADRLIAQGKTLRFVNYLDDYPVAPLTNIWTDTQTSGFGADRLYVVQTNTRVIERCILMATDPGDLVVDPTCGSGTTAFVAEQWGRRWITVDTSRVALTLARQRLMCARYPSYLLADSIEGQRKEQSLTARTLPRNEPKGEIRQGFVYERVSHIMLGAIANNPDIKAGMTQQEIDAAIKRHAEFELLYDKPFLDPDKVRVAGPFTVESLSPHRALSFGDSPDSLSETEAAKDADAPNFEQSILDNLAKAGIQNGRKKEKFVFASFETYAGSYIQAVGERVGGGSDSPSRIAIAIGPQYGTVSASFVKKAAREAINAEGVDLLAILGFAFDPQVTGVTEDDGVTVEATDEGFATVEGIRKVRIQVSSPGF